MARRYHNTRRNVEPEHRINSNIRVPEVRLVGDDLEAISEAIGRKIEIGVYNTREALRIAQDAELDLVEISPKASPPVCKIINYKKFLYQKKKREKELKSKAVKTVVKEIRFGPNTDDHDFEFKLKHAQNFLEEGAKVKAYVQFKGRNIVFQDRGELLLLKFLKELESYGSAEALPKLEGKKMTVIVNPQKKKKK